MAPKHKRQASRGRPSAKDVVRPIGRLGSAGPVADLRPSASPARDLQNRIASELTLRKGLPKRHGTGLVLTLLLALSVAGFSLMAML
jgi:hypothetical protein